MKVTVIIPYKEDRGYLSEAIASVPKDCQLILAKGNGTWPQNFNKVLPQAKGEFIKYLHDDDILTENCIRDSVEALKDCDFIHGNAYMIREKTTEWRAPVKTPTLQEMIQRNVLHSATLMYKRSVFEKIGSFDEDLKTCEEYEFNLRCLAAGLKIGYCDSFLAYYRFHPQMKTITINEKRRNADRQKIRAYYRANNNLQQAGAAPGPAKKHKKRTFML